MELNETPKTNFIHQEIDKDLSENKNGGAVLTRFPPEPNGYLHIGHAKSICLNFGLGKHYNGGTNLRFDDTNPTKEDTEYVDSIKEDVNWLGFQWKDEPKFTSDYFEQLYQWAVLFIKNGKAYVDDQSAEEIASQKGTPTTPGQESPFRNRSAEENLDLFERMRKGEFQNGERVLRAKIDMASPNMHLRDPLMYRIIHAHHHRTGNEWCIYPMYDFAHGQGDFKEGITHSVCTLEFEVHRPLYNWFLEQILEFQPELKELARPRQIEFARLNLNYTVMSKRKLLQLVEQDYVAGWDDPRMPTISGYRRRGYTPESIRKFADQIGVAKRENVIDVALLEHCVREDLNKRAPRVYAVLNPVKVIITNFPEGQVEWMEAINNPEDESMGSRKLPFSREIYIERDDFMENAPRKFFRMDVGREVRLKNAYIVKCEDIKKDENGEISEIYCTYDPDTKSGMEGSNRKVKGTLHWVSIEHAKTVQVKQYDRLFMDEAPDGHKDKDFLEFLNPSSLSIINTGFIEPNYKDASANFDDGIDRYQFQRLGYFCVDKDTTGDQVIFNRTVTLKDSWAKKKK
ncbi:glutamine--tRNA ligase/YqeY domain fusion protein [Carboxylicivirga sp. M1479]|uniref:glutamine--tRNA ligase/YqeY domain fusion protein n=1 Tax=Carboxylicivirga sp. M1479 TaxID=2594476 RepID=UPI0011788F66|nr:glutamine--tRNA ligase/YqeY domain fusion protein [Carboxylicivirga sp. M1479]TRX72101.1 glutamine--tRNA ligase/YqeY domain fusion protein [Carboxylicivirga sp. M1479]